MSSGHDGGKNTCLTYQNVKWTVSQNDVGVHNIVIIKDDNVPRSFWQLVHVCVVNRSSDGHVRTVKLAPANACLDRKGRRVQEVKFLECPVQKLVLLMSKDDYESESQGVSQPRSH